MATRKTPPQPSTAGRTFDARPDRVDFRDRVYTPPLIALPAQTPDPKQISKYFPEYAAQGLVLDQGSEGACTGFGLAGVINHMAWRRSLAGKQKRAGVSPRMLYQLARQYDEWPGEDYDGSSCRGAMKGWHRHGVCSATLWPYANRRGEFIKPKAGWEQDAALRPLGAYYRVDMASIADMQAAIFEVGAIYVSADVHAGWSIKRAASLPVIPCHKDTDGGHAFALVGYTPEGFIVQNSWGPGWGFHGFAVMTYEDWVLHGNDAWVAAMGAPMLGAVSARTRSSESLRDRQAAPNSALVPVTAAALAANPATLPWSEAVAYEHSVVLGNNGEPQNRFISAPNAAAAVQMAAYESPLAWLKARPTPRIAIYAHGGLNDEAASIKRIRVLAPYFAANNIYPLFITWRTGVWESIVGMLHDTTDKLFGASIVGSGWEWARDQADRAIEALAERALVKPVWMQIKQNAEAAADGGSGLWQVATHLRALKQALPSLEIHLVGHSAGAILLGHLLDLCAPAAAVPALAIRSASLFAPACTLGFANRRYIGAAGNGVLRAADLHVDLMSNERELADTVGPYGKSLLYLVSRALESVHKMPLLGMEAAWHPLDKDSDGKLWNSSAVTIADLAQWRAFSAGGAVALQVHADKLVRTGTAPGQSIALAHGSFDNDIDVISATLARVLGTPPAVPVDNLQAF
ncbi:MAG: family peptidase domain protein [Hydrocarboniphaga sp.]|uniref:C1 family peptidase n=1 Tax=Hydrocarboniphaga sp. TaxID=2033016 RepID=UPI0026181B0B|nr:C1 family peptidase [Hydrocarboniphaga sp.]MDB5973002.1 family peptidase domain protein [Hydrocarboniphaga sp.]